MQEAVIMLDFSPFPLLIGILILVVLLTILWHHGRSRVYLFFFSVFWIYILLVAGATIFPIPLPGSMDGLLAKQQITYTLSYVNFVPFKYLNFPNTRIIFLEILQNILLTIPFGFGISFVARLRAKDFIWLAIALGFGIELTQLVISLVIGPYRTVDITDVILNALGVLLGYCLFRVFAWLYLKITKRLGDKPQGLLAYIYDVASQV
jgi:glycopeptide antibiotics resistance protein